MSGGLYPGPLSTLPSPRRMGRPSRPSLLIFERRVSANTESRSMPNVRAVVRNSHSKRSVLEREP